MVTTRGGFGVPCRELLEDAGDGGEAAGVGVVEHHLGDPAGGAVAQERAVHQGHPEARRHRGSPASSEHHLDAQGPALIEGCHRAVSHQGDDLGVARQLHPRHAINPS